MHKDNTGLWNRFWRDKNGQVVIYQPPNLPLIIWFAAHVLSILLKDTKVDGFFAAIAFAALIIWAGLETLMGASYFRKLLGLCVLAAAISAKIS